MKEGKIEKIKKDEISVFLDGETDKSKNELNPSPLRLVERKDIIGEAEEMFRLFKSGEFEAAQAMVSVAKGVVEKMKKSTVKQSNEVFIQFFDHAIQKAIENKQTQDFNAQDNL